MDYFIQCITKKYAEFSGRARRAEYWYFTLFNILFQVGIGIVLGILAGGIAGSTGDTGGAVALISLIPNLVALALFLPGLAVTIRRLHDIGKSGWWVLIAFIPILGAIILLIFMVTPGNAGSNQYGPDPKANS